MNFEDMFIEVSKLVFNDQNLDKYFTMLFYHYEYDFTHEDCFLETENNLLKINKILSETDIAGEMTMALSNRYMACLFYLSYYACSREETKEIKEIIGLLNNSSMIKRFSDVSSEPFSDKFKARNQEKWKAVEENLIKNHNERLKDAYLSITRLEDENEQLKQRIEKGKKIWDDNKQLKEENEKLKLMLKKLGVNESPIVRSSTDEDLSVQGTLSSQSGTISVSDSKNPMMTDLSTPSKNNIDHTRSYAHTFREHGRFGSHPSHDDFGDESAP